MALTKVSGGVLQQPIDVGIVTASNGTFSGNLNVAGVSTFQGNVDLGDDDRLRLGASQDLQIWHDGSNSVISNTGTGSLVIRATNLSLQAASAENYAYFSANGATTLYYDNSIKFQTTGFGVTVFDTLQSPQINITGVSTFANTINAVDASFSGNVSIAGTLTYDDVTNVDSIGIITARSDVLVGGNLNVTGVSTFQGNVNLGDGDILNFGDDGDLRIYHDGNDSYITDLGTGNLHVNTNGSAIRFISDGSTLNGKIADFNKDGAVNLYYDNSKKFETTGTGVTITGDARVTGILTVGQSSVTIDGANNKITTPKLDYAGISSSIADTAVDIFVYDTRKDSDGGAWRKRTQHTSWYNETLNTATRGSRRDFPAVAVIVVSTDTVKIYDGDDPDLPMWMIFNGGSYQNMIRSNANSVYALNGTLAVGSIGEGLIRIEFIADRSKLTHSAGNAQRYFKGNISQRNTTNDYDYGSPALWGSIVDGTVNDVAMTMLPNAPIDDATGLPIPTIAVATNGGISVIKDDGTVISATTTGYPTRRIDIKSTGELFHQQGSGSNEGICFNYPFTRISGLGLETYANSSTFWYASDGTGNYSNYLGNAAVAPTALSASSRSSLEIGDNRGLTFVSVNAGADVASHSTLSTYSLNNGMVAYATTSYNTGWMHGDIKGAFLSGISTASVTGTELVTNGTFDSDVSGWIFDGTTTLAYSSGEAQVTVTSGGHYVSQQITVTPNTTYTYKWDARRGTISQLRMSVFDVSNIVDIVPTYTYSSTTSMATYSLTFKTPSNCTSINVYLIRDSAATGTAFFDNASLRIADPDRSVNNKGLQVFGTITKSAVATGAELVAYSGWSSSNYLRQPYNSALDFGTGDWCYMFWYNPNDAESGDIIFSRWSYNVDSNASPRIQAYFNSGNLRVDVSDNSAGSYQGHFGSDGTQDTNTWHCAAIIRRGTNLEIWIDGVNYRNAALNSDADGSYTDTNSIIEIGHSPGGGSAEAGLQLALFRISGSAPSAEQIKKIYEDEKVLFQENSACTLHGSSDAVTALAYDDSTNLLYAGTSSGRSDFQGLRRINNTTTAVTTAISASNGLVAEQ